MEINYYQEESRKTAQYPEEMKIFYPTLGLCAEAGELANLVKKKMRGDVPQVDKQKLILELGDCLWYVQQIASDNGISLEEVAVANLTKLTDRAKRNVIKGSGDNR
jgi:NTP pyrophosphatase (non-canonical NTP hydrolase)